jgi:hypothetical protein
MLKETAELKFNFDSCTRYLRCTLCQMVMLPEVMLQMVKRIEY